MKTFSINEIVEVVSGVLVGNTTQEIIGPEQIESASKNHITLIGSKKYSHLWESSKACAAIIQEKIDIEPGIGRALVKVKNPELAMVKLLELFKEELSLLEDGIHPSAVVHNSVKVGNNVSVGACSYVGKNVTLGDGVKIHANVTVLDHTTIGADTEIWSGTVIRENCQIGSRCIFQPNVTIGADGFGYRPSEDGKGLVKIPHIGNVVIGNDVEIGSGTCIDRGKFSSTSIGDGCKIDNLIQIGHNCRFGRSCIIAGHCGISGSVTMGDGVLIGGGVVIKDHITIGDGVTVGGSSIVIKDVPPGKKILGQPAMEFKDGLRHWANILKSAKEK